MKEKNKKEIEELKQAKKFVWIMKEFQKMSKDEQDYFIEFLEGKVDILGKTIKW